MKQSNIITIILFCMGLLLNSCEQDEKTPEQIEGDKIMVVENTLRDNQWAFHDLNVSVDYIHNQDENTLLMSLNSYYSEDFIAKINRGQWQIDKHWQFRAEDGVIGDRKSALVSLNYRFGIKRKRLASE